MLVPTVQIPNFNFNSILTAILILYIGFIIFKNNCY
jgi:hypothetical protein